MRWWWCLMLGCGRIGFDATTTADSSDGEVTTCVVDLAVGEAHGCALLKSGELWCYGLNDFGQLGLGMNSPVMPTPVRPTVTPVAPQGIECGRSLTCVHQSDGRASCFGQNNDQQADGVAITDPVLVPQAAATPALTALHMGFNFVCGDVMGGLIYCWGDGDEGEPGRGVAPDTHPPEQVNGSGWHGLSLGATHACAFANDNTLQCWGDGRDDRLGATPTTQCTIATDGVIVCDMTPMARTNIPGGIGVAAGEGHTCVWTASGDVYCFGKNNLGQCARPPSAGITPMIVSGIPAVTQVVAGAAHTCALDEAGRVWCWGAGTLGQLGGVIDGATPRQVAIDGRALELVTHSLANHTCAIMAGGRAECWGANGSGQLGRGTVSQRELPGAVMVACP